ncbi:MAG: ribonuclease HII [Bacteroidetes bacterium]|nr:ribonuclease HII [Bacteroidota bacterium]MCW5893976.1 ribonuclease HII [Bacteroidota bacterium]
MTSDNHSAPPVDMFRFERELWGRGIHHIAGIDEAGRGPLAGPVVAAAVIFERDKQIPGVNDSKQLSHEEREELYQLIIARALTFGVGIVHHDVIDSINILQATYRAMHEATRQLSIVPDHLLIDGNRFAENGIPFTTIIDGDALSFSVAAASIVAKVTRDRLMVEFDTLYPGYGFAKHKGYATPEHREAIKQLGLCEIHRRSFTVRPQLEFEFSD